MKRTSMRKPLPPRTKSVPQRGTGRGAMGPAELGPAQPKRIAVRSKELREAYRLIPCQWPVPVLIPNNVPTPPLVWVLLPCGKEDGTVCCAHSNWQEHGKGGALKADDSRGASICSGHHHELDQGSRMSADERRAGWEFAHRRSVALLVAMGKWPADVEIPE